MSGMTVTEMKAGINYVGKPKKVMNNTLSYTDTSGNTCIQHFSTTILKYRPGYLYVKNYNSTTTKRRISKFCPNSIYMSRGCWWVNQNSRTYPIINSIELVENMPEMYGDGDDFLYRMPTFSTIGCENPNDVEWDGTASHLRHLLGCFKIPWRLANRIEGFAQEIRQVNEGMYSWPRKPLCITTLYPKHGYIKMRKWIKEFLDGRIDNSVKM